MCSSLLNFLRRLVFTLEGSVIGQNCFCFCLFVSFFFLLIIPIDFFCRFYCRRRLDLHDSLFCLSKLLILTRASS